MKLIMMMMVIGDGDGTRKTSNDVDIYEVGGEDKSEQNQDPFEQLSLASLGQVSNFHVDKSFDLSTDFFESAPLNPFRAIFHIHLFCFHSTSFDRFVKALENPRGLML